METVPTNQQELRAATAKAVAAAGAAWAGAPMHFKAMAGAYVGPLLAALQAGEAEAQALHQRKKELADFMRERFKDHGREITEMVDNFTRGF